ncbi:MAG: hypothetical protein L3J83_12810, partial [Proteobacteria bacterium]|nr:hypothetical protein [Pseudomonadota bacterium]
MNSDKHTIKWFALILLSSQVFAFEEIEVTPITPQGWQAANVRADAIVEINDNQPLFGNGSLMFATDTQTAGQDKADYQLIWQQSTTNIDFPTRTLGNVEDLSFAWRRDSTSTTAVHFAPVFRLNFYDDGGTPLDLSDDKTGFLIWEGVYNGINPAPTDNWQLDDIFNDNFWIFVSGQGTINVFNATLNDWINNNPSPDISLSSDTLIFGINVGVGSGWGNTFIGYVDAVRISFGTNDDRLFHFENYVLSQG